MIIAITGSRGFVGSALARYAMHDGHTVRFLDRPLFQLGEQLPDAWLKDVDLLIHCAYDFTHPKNVKGARVLFSQAKDIPTVLLSSLSVEASSSYGRTKKAIEKVARQYGVHIVRAGLIYEEQPGSIFGRIVKAARFTPVLPMISRSWQFTTHTEDLYKAILAAPKTKKVIIAANDQPVRLENVIMKFTGWRLFVHVPFTFLHGVLCILEKLHLSFGLRADSLIGLAHSHKPDFTETRRLGLRFRSLDVS